MSPSVFPLPEPKPARDADTIRVFLRDCAIELYVGVHAHEKIRPQRVIANLEVEAALPHHYQDSGENDLDRVINYEKFHEFIGTELPKLGHVPLLESVAEQIISFCFKDPRIQTVRVRLEKPGIFANSAGAGVEISRARHNGRS